jgi:EAL domain-containing protein (putative c-di-GMP-specific phosphodiesterase class I)
MENQEPENVPQSVALRRRAVMPRACIVDAEQSMRTFMVESLQELGFITGECAQLDELAAAIASRRPELVVIGSSAGGIEACQMVELLAARGFEGKVLVVGPRVSPMVTAVRELGAKLGLAMLALLPTPFSGRDMRDCVAALIPREAAPNAATEPARAAVDWLTLSYQPKVDTRTLALVGAEALVRVRHPTRGFVASDDGEFHLGALSDFVIARAVDDWRFFAARHGHLEIGINLPLDFLRDAEATANLCRLLPDHPAFKGLIIEITAAEAVRNLDLLKAISRRLRFRSIAISIDGVGAEWHALARVHDFPFVELKVARQFVAGCATDRVKQATCRRIVDLADAVGARSVAEGVASRGDFLAVREMGFHMVQGFPHATPMTAQAFAQTVLDRSGIVPN